MTDLASGPPIEPQASANLPNRAHRTQDQQDELRRVQTGGIGIVAVLLLIGLASTLTARSGSNAAEADPAVKSQIANDGAAKSGEPLVELGVQPSTQKDSSSVAPASGQPTPAQGQTQSAAPPTSIPSQPVPVAPDGSVPDLRPDPNAQKAVRPN